MKSNDRVINFDIGKEKKLITIGHKKKRFAIKAPKQNIDLVKMNGYET